MRTGPDASVTPFRGARPALLLALVVALIGSMLVARPESAQATTPTPLATGWIPNWATAAGQASVEGNVDLVGEASPFWYSAVAKSGAVTVSPSVDAATMAGVLASLRTRGIAVIPSVADGSQARAMAKVLADRTDRARHVSDLVAVVLAEGYDGIELDYEKFAFADGSSTWTRTRPAWLAFVAALSKALHARGKVLAVAVPPIYNGKRDSTSGYWVYDYAGMRPYVDSLRIMTYDYSVSYPGPISPLEFVRRTLVYATSAFPAQRIRMGVPAYGRVWVARRATGARAISGTCPTNTPLATRSFTTAKAGSYLTERNGAKPPPIRFEPTSAEAVSQFTRTYKGRTAKGRKTTCTVTYQAWWVDSRGVAARLPLVRQFKLAGIAFWHLGGVDRATWALLGGKPAPPPPPTPTSVTLAAAPARPRAHEVVTLTARTKGAPVGAPVVLDRKLPGASAYKPLTAGRVAAGGQVVFKVGVTATTRFRVRLPAAGGRAGSLRTLKVNVVPRVRAEPSTYRPTAGSVVRVAVVVAPGVKGMKVRRQVRTGGGWETLATTKTDARGRASFRLTWPKARTTMTYRIITSKKGAMAAGGTSPHFTLRSR